LRVIERLWQRVYGGAVLGSLWLAPGWLYGQSGTGGSSAAMEHEFEAAMAAQDKGDLSHAEAILAHLHAEDSSLFAVNESLGLVYVARERFDKALPLLEAAAREQPSSDVAHANLGAAYFRLHRNPEALSELESAARLNPTNASTQQALGQLYMETHKPGRAAEAFGKAIEQKPGDPDLLLNRAQALNEAGEPAQAADTVMNMPGSDQSAAAQTLLGDIEEKRGDYLASARHYESAAQLDPSEANAWMVGLELLRHWTFDAAAREFEAGVQKFPQSQRMKLGLGAAYFGDAHYDKAIPVFADLLESDKSNALYAELLGLSCNAVMQGAMPGCSGLLGYAESHPNDAKASTFAASTLIEGVLTAEHTSLARKLLKNAIAADPTLADAQFRMGVLLQEQSDWAGSIGNLEKAVALKPDLALAHYRLSIAYWRTGRKQEAETQMDLQKKYSQQQQDDLDKRMRQITTFLVDAHN
jgi:tetratricopeptide (TPR) repeat protein